MIQFKRHSGIYTLTTEQVLNVPFSKSVGLFQFARKLTTYYITPPHMGFEITAPVTQKAYAGQIVTYRVGILPAIKTNWVTEITRVEEQAFFIDEQRFGPYKMWHHEHWFEALPDGRTLMKDKISYKIPFGFLGHIAQRIFIKRQLKGIFEFRLTTLGKQFNAK